MPKSSIVDSGAIVALLDPRDEHHHWAKESLTRHPVPWFTCEAVLSEVCFLLHAPHLRVLNKLLRQGYVLLRFDLHEELPQVLNLMAKYADVPMSLADACIVRMSETLPDPVVISTDSDFKFYRRHSRHVVPCLLPGRSPR